MGTINDRLRLLRKEEQENFTNYLREQGGTISFGRYDDEDIDDRYYAFSAMHDLPMMLASQWDEPYKPYVVHDVHLMHNGQILFCLSEYDCDAEEPIYPEMDTLCYSLQELDVEIGELEGIVDYHKKNPNVEPRKIHDYSDPANYADGDTASVLAF